MISTIVWIPQASHRLPLTHQPDKDTRGAHFCPCGARHERCAADLHRHISVGRGLEVLTRHHATELHPKVTMLCYVTPMVDITTAPPTANSTWARPCGWPVAHHGADIGAGPRNPETTTPIRLQLWQYCIVFPHPSDGSHRCATIAEARNTGSGTFQTKQLTISRVVVTAYHSGVSPFTLQL